MIILMVCFFGTIIAVNLTMALLAQQSWSGLIVKNGYVANQTFNMHAREAREQADLGWSERIVYQDRQLTFTVTDTGGKPVELSEMEARISRPVHTRDDQTLSLSDNGAGFTADFALADGPWDIALRGQRPDGGIYRQKIRLLVSGGVGR